ncbi:MAG: hypothetical protein ACRCVN_07075 [Spirochaetia bacterium]
MGVKMKISDFSDARAWQIFKASKELEKVVSDEVKPFSGRVSGYFSQISSAIKFDVSRKDIIQGSAFGTMFFATSLGLVAAQASLVGGAAVLATGMAGGGAVAAALLVAHAVLPPVASAFSKIAEKIEMIGYMNKGKSITEKFIENAGGISKDLSINEFKQALEESKKSLLKKLEETPLGRTPEMQKDIYSAFERNINKGFEKAVKERESKDNSSYSI